MSKSRMLTVLMFGIAAIPAISHARSVVVYDEPLDQAQNQDQISANFAYNSDNPDAGWAWVDVTAASAFSDGKSQLNSFTFERRVPGLRYDAHAGQIIYQPSNGSRVVCATVSESGFLFVKKKKLELTGNCSLHAVVEQRSISDSNHGESKNYGKVTMEVSI